MKFLNHNLFTGDITVNGTTTLSTATGVTRATGDSSTHLATTAFVKAQDYATNTALGNYVPLSRTLTINGVTFDLSANRSWTIATSDYTSTVKHAVKAGVAITKGQAVYVTSSDGTNMIVGLASNATEATSSKTMGLAETTVSANGFTSVITEGLLAGLDTSTAVAGDPVWLGVNGNLIFGLLNKPISPLHLVYIGVVTRVQQNNGEIFVKVQNGIEIDEVHDIQISLPATGQLLRRDTDGYWKNWTPNFLVPSNVSGTTNYVSKFTGTNTVGNSQIFDNGTNVGIGTTAPNAKLDISGGYIRLEELSNNANGWSVWSSAGYLSSRITTSGHSRSWGWEFTDNYPDSATANVFFRVGYNGAVSYLTSGNFGIGTSSPTVHSGGNALVVKGASGVGSGRAIIELHDSGSTNKAVFQQVGSTTYIGNLGGAGGLSLLTNGNGSSASESMFITAAGNVGIGTTSPGELLEVVGNIRANVSNGGGFMLTGASASGLVRAGATGLALRTDTTDRLTIDNSGAATFSSSVTVERIQINSSTYEPLAINSSYGQVGLKFGLNGNYFAAIGSANNVTGAYAGSETDLGLGTYGSATANITFVTGTGLGRRMTITAAGNVGIGTASPANKLQVANGDMSITSGYSFILADTDTNWRLGRNIITPVESVYLNSNTFEFVAANVSDQGWQFINDDGYPVLEIGAATGSRNVWVNAGNLLVPTGNVGIGTTSPSTKLHVFTTSNSDQELLRLTVAPADSSGAKPKAILGFYTPAETNTSNYTSGRITSKFDIAGYANSRVTIESLDSGGNFIETLTAKNGNVGIGTTSPTEKLHVGGRVRIATIDNGTGDFATISGTGVITRRTAAQVLSDIGAQPSGSYLTAEADTLATVTGRGATTTSPITINGGGTQPLSLTTNSGSPWHLSLNRTDLGLTSRVFAHNSPYNGWYFEHNISIAGNTNWHSGNLTNLNQLTNGPGYITGYTETDTLATVTARGSSTNGSIYVNGLLTGGLGAATTLGTLDWNDSSNARAGQGYTLLLGNHSNGPGPAEYFHPVGFEYGTKDGSGNVTQLAISYGSPGDKMYMRGRYSGSWTGWTQFITSANIGSQSVNYASSAGNAATATSATSATSATQVVTLQDDPPAGVNGKLWWETDTGKLKVYYGASSAWVDALPMPDMTLYLSTAGGAISGDLSIAQTLTVTGNILSSAVITATGGNSTQWNTAYGWGNHASAGYLTSLPAHTHDDRYYTETESDAKYLIGTTNPGTPGNFILSIGNNGTYSYVQSHSSQPLRLNPLGNALEGPSGSTIWHSGNDGSGSGLDADLLDGNHASAFYLASNPSGYISSYTETDTLATVTSRGASTSTDLTFNGTLTMGTGGTQYIRMGRFPASVTNTGEAWIGRASDRSTGTMTVQLGNNAARIFEIVDHAWSTVILDVGMNSFSYKGNTIWHAGNDGAGSGLDADLWDGYHVGQFSNWNSRSANDIVTGMMSWRNYGNNHVIFDASASLSPAGTAINNTTPQNLWTGTYPTLMGWNGTNTYGVRVDVSRASEYATSAGNADTVDSLHASDFVRAYTTTSDNIDSNWGQSFKTFDPVPSGTPPIASPNLRTINVGEDFDRRTQLAFTYATDQAWFRRRDSSGWQTWREFIHSGNIGSQSVSYATTAGTAGALTSMNISQFTNNSGYIAAGSTVSETAVWTGATKFRSAGDISQTGAGNHALQILSDDGNDAFIAFHISSDYAVYFGLENSTNRLYTGGWSDGGNKYQIWDSRDFSSTSISNWNTAYNWGNHAGLYAAASHNHDDRYYTETESDNRFVNVSGDTMNGSLSFDAAAVIKKRITGVGDNPVKTASGVLASRSDNGGGATYYIIETNVPQNDYQMGGFTIELFGRYGETNNKTKIDLGGYWNPAGNGGFVGFEAHGTNPQYKPTIQVARNNNTGNTAFIISGVSWSYPVIVARDLWLGYNSTDGGSYGEGWVIASANNIDSYSNRDTVVWRNGYSDSNPAGYITGYTETDTLASVTGRGASTSTAVSLSGGATISGITNNGDLVNNGKIVVQNTTNGTNARGIFMWQASDSNWGIYMATSAAGVSLSGGNAVASIDGRTSHHIRFRAHNATGNGFIWENDSEQCVMSLTTDTGNLYTRGQIYAGNSTSNLVWHAGNLTNLNQLTNGPGYITGNQTITLGGDVSGSGTTSIAVTVDSIDGWAFVNTGSNSPINADTINSNGISYYTGGVTNFSGNATDGALYSQRYSDNWQHQIAGDYRSGQIALRGKNNGTWQAWRTVLDSSNFTSWAVSTTYNSSLNSDSRNSRGVTRLYRRDSDSDYSVQVHWTGAHWFIRGYEGDTLHAEARVGYADSAGSAGSASSATSATQVVTIQDDPPTGANGKLWWESDTGKLKVYYGSSSAWVDATPVPDMSLYYAKAGGPISGDVTIQQTLTVVGNTLVQGTLTETSDISLKENIVPLESSLDKVMQLNGVSFNKKATPNVKEIGFIAQEVEAVIPDLVTETNEGIKTVSYSRVTAVLVETIKEQQAQIEELKNMVNMLAEKVNNL